MFLVHLLLGILTLPLMLCCCNFAAAHFKLASVSLCPFGSDIDELSEPLIIIIER